MKQHKAYIIESNGKVEYVILVSVFIADNQPEADVAIHHGFTGQSVVQASEELNILGWKVSRAWIKP